MRDDDLDAVLAVQAQCYPAPMQEAAAVVQARLRAARPTTLVACDGAHGAVCAYVFAYPSRLGRVTALDAPFAPQPQPDTLYIHDLAVAPRAHGAGLGRRLVRRLFALARDAGLAHAALVSVQDTRRFWEGMGYEVDAQRPPCAALASYPGGALYMRRLLSDYQSR